MIGKLFYAIQIYIYIYIYKFKDKAFHNNIWENWEQSVHTLGDIGLQCSLCDASRSTLNLMFSKIRIEGPGIDAIKFKVPT